MTGLSHKDAESALVYENVEELGTSMEAKGIITMAMGLTQGHIECGRSLALGKGETAVVGRCGMGVSILFIVSPNHRVLVLCSHTNALVHTGQG